MGYGCYTAGNYSRHAQGSIAVGLLVNRTGSINDTTGTVLDFGSSVNNGINSISFGSQIKNFGLNACVFARIGYISVAGTNASGFGKNISISAAGGSVLGGVSNTVSGAYGTVLGGYLNTASGAYSAAMGYRSEASRTGELAHNSVAFADAAGGTYSAERGYHRMTANVKTADDTQTTLMDIVLTAASAIVVEFTIVGNQSGGSNRASYKRRATVYRDGSATAALQGSVETIGTDVESDANWNVAVDVDSNSVRVRVTGVAATNINWGAVAQWVGVGEVVN
jgi:hypothetical protein